MFDSIFSLETLFFLALAISYPFIMGWLWEKKIIAKFTKLSDFKKLVILLVIIWTLRMYLYNGDLTVNKVIVIIIIFQSIMIFGLEKALKKIEKQIENIRKK